LPVLYIAGAIQCGAEMLLLAAPPAIQAILATLQGDGVVFRQQDRASERAQNMLRVFPPKSFVIILVTRNFRRTVHHCCT
jgi:hypothetical protein